MSNSDNQPWAPDPATAPGTPPSSGYNGTGGERGTSSFDGSSGYTYEGYEIGTNPARGPRLGVDYAVANGTDTIVASAVALHTRYREAAGTHAALTHTNVLTASTLSPAADASVTLTATLASSSDFLHTGTVTFKEGATTLGTGVLNGSEVATYVHSAGFAAGAHVLTAVFPGDANYAALTSAAITVTAT